MRDNVILPKLLRYVEKVLEYTKEVSRQEFFDNSVLLEACVFNLSQLGELCRSVNNQLKQTYPQIPWHEMYGLRNRIVHDYDGVDPVIIWEIIKEDLPALRTTLCQILLTTEVAE